MASLINARILFVLVVVTMTLVYLCTNKSPSHDKESRQTLTRRDSEDDIGNIDWKNIDLLAEDLPSSVLDNIDSVEIVTSSEDIHGAVTFIQRAEPPEGVTRSGRVVLLLHGAAFTSQTWVDKVDTMRTVAAMGHSVIAIDLPGYGRTKIQDRQVTNDKAAYLRAVLETLTPHPPPVIVTPSMSGSFMLPLVMSGVTTGQVQAWIPVAPVATGNARSVLPSVSIPTMIVMGERDTGIGSRSRDDLSLIPTATKPQVLANAGHPAYLDQPDTWHKLIYNFIKALP